MAFDYSRLKEIAYLSNSVAAVVTNGTGAKSYVRSIILHNTNTTAETVKIYTVPDNSGSVGTATAAHLWFSQTLNPDETVFIEIKDPGIILSDTNDTIQAYSTTANKVTFQAYGGAE